ncbi:MAG: hypothetical protein LBP61_03590 [Desulfovibrio sp.]|jgi:predicted transcriptional regulator|nr:hypothetical protein [Desulfovibrio sp.]
MRPIAIRLDDRTRWGLELLARVTGQSCAEHAARALRDYVQAHIEALVDQGKITPGDRPEEDKALPRGRWDLLV